MLLYAFYPQKFYCRPCNYSAMIHLTVGNSTALTVQANDRTWGEITRTQVPQAFHDAFEGEELAP